jgi:superfamily II DNA or RNA helicase
VNVADLPRPGALVRVPTKPNERGIVVPTRNGALENVAVRWPNASVTVHHPGVLTSGFEVGMEVLHDAPYDGIESLGHGRIIATRVVAGSRQHLVEFWPRAEARWVPWTRLTKHAGVDQRLERGTVQGPQAAESLRLRNLAYALDDWHATTGGLSRLEIDPLPHQLHLVHTILSSGNLNWLIADDVGLGKTIEVGLLLAALRQRRWRRFLLVVPAGLTRQWQEEMREKFFLDAFHIYGETVLPETPAQWRGLDQMIVSIDRAKMEEHAQRLALAEPWDLVVFDEAHWLARREYGWKFELTQRYELAHQLRQATEHMLLLSGTPHQGRDDLFRALLELLRPGASWRKRFQRLAEEPEILKSMVVRNRKADVIDLEGNYIFRGKTSRTVDVEATEPEIAFDAALTKYFTSGYAAAASKGLTGMAIGFAMTTYRKMAASSLAAIAKSLHRRRARLQGLLDDAAVADPTAEPDSRFVEGDEDVVGDATEFFSGERDMLDDLIDQAYALVDHDSKVRSFLDYVLPGVLASDPKRKLLVFTEYRTTQDLLVRELAARFGGSAVALIRGGQHMRDRREIVDRFNDDLQFLVSTEAGGEGLNLQQRCNVLVNFDLPWNPMRLVQRVGRLYRYGQKEHVVVFNLRVAHTLDQKILGGMYERLENVARDMAAVASENAEGLIEDLLGQLVAALDVEAILADAASKGPELTEERIAEAIARARAAAAQQDDLLKYAAGFDPKALTGTLPVELAHFKTFVAAMLERLGTPIEQQLYDGDVWEIRPSEALKQRFGFRTTLRVAFDRTKARKAKAVLLDAEHPLVQHLLDEARDPRRPGATAVVDLPDGAAGYSAMLRWLDDAGTPVRSQYAHVWLASDGTATLNDERWASWLLEPAEEAEPKLGKVPDHVARARSALDLVLRERATPGTRPDERYPISATSSSSTAS